MADILSALQANVTPAAILPALVDTIEIRTAYTPPMVFKMDELLADGPPSPAVKFFKPMLIMTGGIGRKVVAPAGEVEEEDWQWPVYIAGAAAVFGAFAAVKIIYEIGKHKGKKAIKNPRRKRLR